MSDKTIVAKTKIPEYESRLRHNIIRVPEAAYKCSGISVFGRRLKTFIFSTDIAIIRNCDADAVFAVYPFTPQSAISESIIKGAYTPVFCGVGGGTTQGARTVALAKDVEAQGACGVVLNAPVSDLNIFSVSKAVDVPVVITVVSESTDIKARLDAGASILNVAAADKTPELVKSIRSRFPDVPIIATGGPTEESIRKTVEAGANAITYTPPSAKELFSALMEKYRM
ncbi:MAG: hydrolase [Clostridia bacterium]|nr:hydrolase [Clostridia bacterium]